MQLEYRLYKDQIDQSIVIDINFAQNHQKMEQQSLSNFGQIRSQLQQPVVQSVPQTSSENFIGAPNPNYIVVRPKLSESIKSVHVTSDNRFVVFGAMRKIFFCEANQFETSQKNKMESKISQLGKNTREIETQKIECHPMHANVIASVSNNSLNIWDLELPEQTTQEYSIVNSISSIGWQHNDSKLIAMAAGDNLVCLYDVRSNSIAKKFNLNLKTDVVSWNPCNEHMFATGHTDSVKIWDVRNMGDNLQALQTLALNSAGSVNQIQFDPVSGKLLMTQDKSMIRLFSVDQGIEFDHYKQAHNKQLVSASFLPLRDSSIPGIIALPQRSHNFLYLSVNEGQGQGPAPLPNLKSKMKPPSKMKARISNSEASGSEALYSGSEQQELSPSKNDKSGQLKLHFTVNNQDEAAPKLQMTSQEAPHDNDAYAIRVKQQDQGNQPSTDQFQVISITSFSEIRLMTLNQPFIERFYLNQDGENGLNLERKLMRDEDEQYLGPQLSPQESEAQSQEKKMTPADQKKKEIEILKKQTFIANVQLSAQITGAIEEWKKDTDLGESFQLSMTIRAQRKKLVLKIDVPKYYPHAPIEVSFGNQISITQELADEIEESVNKERVLKSKEKFMAVTSIVTHVHTMLGGQEQSQEMSLFDFDDEEVASSFEAEEEVKSSSVSPIKSGGVIGLFAKQKSFGIAVVNKQEPARKKGYFAYPKTCGFAWNQYGQIVYFSNGKYDLKVLEKDQGKKKFTEWPGHYKQIQDICRDYDDKNYDRADHQPTNSKLIEMQRRKGDNDRSLSRDDSSDSGDETDQSSFYSESQDCSSQTNSQTVDSSDEEQIIVLAEEALQLDRNVINVNVDLNKIQAFKQITEDNDDDEILLGNQGHAYKLFIHNCHDKIGSHGRPSPMIARNLHLEDIDTRQFCQQASQYYQINLMGKSNSYQLDLVKYWSLIGVSLGNLDESKMKIWGAHPLGKGLLFKALKFFQNVKDYQQVAIIATLLFQKEQQIYLDQIDKIDRLQMSRLAQQEEALAFQRILLQHQEENQLLRQANQSGSAVSGIKRSLIKNNSSGNLLKKNLTDYQKQTRDARPAAYINSNDLKFVATNMPNSLQQENFMENLTSPKANPNIYPKMMTLSNRDSHNGSSEESESDEEIEFQTSYEPAPNVIRTPKPTPDNSLGTEEFKATPFTSQNHVNEAQLEPGNSANMWNKSYSQQRVNAFCNNNSRSIGNQISSRAVAMSSPEFAQNSGQIKVSSPGSPTVGGILNTQGHQVTNQFSTKKRSVASSFRSNRRSEYSLHDVQFFATDNSPQTNHEPLFNSQHQLSPKVSGANIKCLLDTLDDAKKQKQACQQNFESTSADSSDLFSSDGEESTQFEASTTHVVEPSELSLILQEDPQNSMTLLLYLKAYSELLYGWGETQMAVQMCKLINDTCNLLLDYHNVSLDESPVILGTNFQRRFPHGKQILKPQQHGFEFIQDGQDSQKQSCFNSHLDMHLHKRDMVLSDYILFSEYQLNYLLRVEFHEKSSQPSSMTKNPKHKKQNFSSQVHIDTSRQTQLLQQQQLNIRKQTSAPSNQDELFLKLEQELSLNHKSGSFLGKCAICESRPDGLIFFCQDCRHGGHYKHMLQWWEMHRKSQGGSDSLNRGKVIVPCPTGCGCTTCFQELERASQVDEMLTSPKRGRAGTFFIQE